MEASERETIITINDADLMEGFFRFGTSKRSHYDRVKKKVGELIIEQHIETHLGAPQWWSLKIDKCALTKTGFSIRRPPKISNEERIARQARAKKNLKQK